MYNSQQISNRQLKQEKEKLENKKMFLENETEIRTYLAWKQLPQLEQLRIKKRWSDYYEKVKTTPSFKEFFSMKKYWKARKMKRIEELANKARRRIAEDAFQLTKPVEIDPWEFSHGIYSKYNAICNRIRLIDKQLTGIEDVEKIFNPSNF